ncbi:MAG: hypothetical protein ACOCRX_09150 [Candidatus Woesearchaeota archaeon]
MDILEKIDKYLNEKVELTPDQILRTKSFVEGILNYYKDRKDQFKGASKVDGMAVAVIDYLKSINEPTDHLKDKDLKYVAKKIIDKGNI